MDLNSYADMTPPDLLVKCCHEGSLVR